MYDSTGQRVDRRPPRTAHPSLQSRLGLLVDLFFLLVFFSLCAARPSHSSAPLLRFDRLVVPMIARSCAPLLCSHRRRHLHTLLLAALALLLLLLALAAAPAAADADLDPYRVLGVSRSSSAKDVRSAYKTQAKLW